MEEIIEKAFEEDFFEIISINKELIKDLFKELYVKESTNFSFRNIRFNEIFYPYDENSIYFSKGITNELKLFKGKYIKDYFLNEKNIELFLLEDDVFYSRQELSLKFTDFNINNTENKQFNLNSFVLEK
jgi:hypothetical protein